MISYVNTPPDMTQREGEVLHLCGIPQTKNPSLIFEKIKKTQFKEQSRKFLALTLQNYKGHKKTKNEWEMLLIRGTEGN